MPAYPPKGIQTILGQQHCRDLVEHHRRVHSRRDDQTGCWIWTAQSTNGNGYPSIKAAPRIARQPPGVQAQWLLHRVALVSVTGVDIQGEASHLCGVRLCFNPAHLCDESHAINESRKSCVGHLVCAWHGHPIGNFCQHVPGCIRAPRNDLNCCLRLKESDPEGWAQLDTQRSTSASVGDIESQSSTGLAPAPQPPEHAETIVDPSPDGEAVYSAASSSDRSSISPSQLRRSSTPRPATLSGDRPSVRHPSMADPSSPLRIFESPSSARQSTSDSDPVVVRRRRLPQHDPPSGPSTPVHRRPRLHRDVSSTPTINQSSDSIISHSPTSRGRRSVGRPAVAPDTQQVQAVSAYFEEDEAQDTQYRRAAQAANRTGVPDSSSSYRE